MPWSLFRRTRDVRPDESWWRTAEQVAAGPTPVGLAALRAGMTTVEASADEADRQAELIEGIERLLELRGGPLPDLPTQHRVIASDRCHFIAPVSLLGPTSVAGKLFLTSHRALFVGPTVTAWPWHRVRGIDRQERDVVLTILGADLLIVRCNTYGDALEARFVAEALASAAGRPAGPPA
jgi:hypothetical protein